LNAHLHLGSGCDRIDLEAFEPEGDGLRWSVAADEAIHVIAKDGQTFVIEAADDFDQEVARLRQRESFMAFLTERSKARQGPISLETFEREIDEALAHETTADDE
jgi:hypothetical protein